MLQESRRQQLDTIVQQMIDNKETDNDIQFVVNDFVEKYGTETAPQTPTFGSRVKQAFGERQEQVEQAADLYGGKQQTLAESALQTAGAGAGLLTDIGVAGLKTILPRTIKENIKTAVAKSDIPKIAEVADKFGEKYPRVARDIMAVADIVSVFPQLKALDASRPFIAAKVNILKQSIKNLGTVTPEKAVINIEKAKNIVYETIRPSKGEIRKFEIRQGKDIRDISGFIAEEKLIPEVRPDKTMDWKNAVEEQIEKVRIEHDALNKLLEPSQSVISLETIIERGEKRIDDLYKNATEAKDAKTVIKELISNEIEKYGTKTLGLKQINDVKSGLWSIGYRADKPLNARIGRILGHEISEEMESFLPRGAKELNETMAKRMDAIAIMENATGRIVKGGRLGMYFSALVGSSIGGALSKIPLIGEVGGYYVGRKAAEYIQKTAPVRAMKKASSFLQKSRIAPPK